MARSKYFVPGGPVGTGTQGRLGEIPGYLMRSGGRGYTSQRTTSTPDTGHVPQGEKSGQSEQMLIDRTQIADSSVYTFDREAMPTGIVANVAAGANMFALVTVVIPGDVRGVVRRFGWYTAGAATAQLSFGLFVNNERVLPGGRWVQDQMQTVLVYNPSAGSIDFDRMTECNIEIPQNGTVTVRVSNADGVNGYQAWARVWGDHWSAV